MTKKASSSSKSNCVTSVHARREDKADIPNPDRTLPGEGMRVGLIGCGGMGLHNANRAAQLGARLVAVCDVDISRLARAGERFPDAEQYTDFRALLEHRHLDAVVCGTVDHWHTLISIAVMRAGKDVYCEKPLTLTIDEGKRLVKVQNQTGQILQTGTQQRSNAGFRTAVEMVRNGRIGRLQRAEVWLPAGLRNGPFSPGESPDGFNYDFWLGPTPRVPYVKERTHFSFRYWWEYSGGTMTDWGAHHNDIVLWAMDMDRSGPVKIMGRQLCEMIPGGYTAASDYEVQYTYPNGVIHTCRSTRATAWNGSVADENGQQHGIKFIGSDGWIWVTRGEMYASDEAILLDKLPDDAERVCHSNDHMKNFLDCVRSRKAPICDAETGHRSATVAHLGVTAIRLGRTLEWDPVKEEYVNDREANRFVAREMRAPYDYNMV